MDPLSNLGVYIIFLSQPDEVIRKEWILVVIHLTVTYLMLEL